ncbi:MAG: DUF3344 domain-containing protein, partial [Verrucomicrobiia bacterium]
MRMTERVSTHSFQFYGNASRAFAALACIAGLILPAEIARAGFASQGHGIKTVAGGALPNAALFMETRATWNNFPAPPKPYAVDVSFVLPPCDAVPFGRLVMTLWGGTANYTCNLQVQINGTNVPNAAPLIFGTTNDVNSVFSDSAPSVYGSGYGVWLVALPVPGDMLFKNGATNYVSITVSTPDSFDGRINQVTLLAIYQQSALNNSFEYVIAEGSGDIYRTPSAPQVDVRTVRMPLANPASATAAKLHVLYTYGDSGQNDRLYFNGVQLGGDDIAGWDKPG